MSQSKVRQRERIEGRFETHLVRWAPVVLLALLAPLTHGLTLVPALVCSMQLFTCKQLVTDHRVLYSVGYFWRRVQQLPLAEVTAVQIRPGLLQRYFDYGTVTVYRDDQVCVVFPFVHRPTVVKRLIVQAVEQWPRQRAAQTFAANRRAAS